MLASGPSAMGGAALTIWSKQSFITARRVRSSALCRQGMAKPLNDPGAQLRVELAKNQHARPTVS